MWKILSSVRRRVVVVTALSFLALVASGMGFARYASTSMEQRLERAREAVAAEVGRLADVRAREPLRDPKTMGRRYLQPVKSGLLTETFDDAGPPQLGDAAISVRTEAAREARERRAFVGRDMSSPIGSPLVIGVAPLPDGNYAWAAMVVPASGESLSLRTVVLVLALSCGVIVLLSSLTLVEFERGGRSLVANLRALETDLRAPVHRPRLAELTAIADGIASLATTLDESTAEREAMQGQLTKMKRVAALGRMAAGVAHEVRNPLAAIKLRADLASQQQDIDPVLHQDLRVISDEVARLDRFVRDLLLVAGEREARREPLEVGELLRRRVDVVRPWAEERHVTVIAEGDASASGDGDALARAIDNLLRNAIEASPSAGTVTAKVRREVEGVVIEVLDQGPGVTSDDGELFEPFFTTKAGGSGLGLALTASVAAAHGGEVGYRRDTEVTCFTLTIRA